MALLLKQYDTPLLKFELKRELDGISANILWKTEDKQHLLPLDMGEGEKGLAKWLSHRTIPSNRAYVQSFLAKLGLNERDTIGILNFCHGLSLNDCYWIVPEDFKGNFAANNLYDNRFSQTLSYMAFTGYGSYVRSSVRSSPEFTTGGMLAKCWRRIDGKIYLYKSGTEGFANSGNEPYSEFYAYQVADAMGLNAVPYGLSKWKGKLCSTCELFTNKDISYVSAGNLIHGNITETLNYYRSLGESFYQELISMFVFDAIICNEDRHFGNFGLLIDNQTNTVLSPAPVFDNGLSLCYLAMEDDFSNLSQYANARFPAAYDDFMGFAKQMMGKTQKDQLKNLIGFHFRKHARYNLSDRRLKVLENLIAERTRELLKL